MKLFLAGNITETAIEVFKNLKSKGYKIYVLQSFWDIYSSKSYTKRVLKIIDVADEFMLDSGAYSMLNNPKAKIKDLDNYILSYVDFVKKHKIKQFIEIDIYDIIGIPETEKIRNKIEQSVGRQCIPVFQKSVGLEYYKSLTKEYQKIAIGGIAKGGDSRTTGVLFKLLSIAEKNNCKVHGLGFTPSNLADGKFSWDTVDSTSWLSPVRYGGHVYKFNGKKIEVIRVKNRRRKDNNRLQFESHQITQWVKFSNHLSR